jgi:hypothetical protein
MKDAYSFSLTPDQFAAAILYRSRKNVLPRLLRYAHAFASFVFLGASAFLFAVAMARRTVPAEAVLTVLAVLAAAVVASHFIGLHASRVLLRRATYMTTLRTLHVEPEGLRQTGDGVELFHRWDSFAGAAIHRDILYLNLDAVTFYPIPLSAFGSQAEAEEFAAYVNERARSLSPSSEQAPPATANVPDSASTQVSDSPVRESRRWDGIRSAIADALRLAFFLPVKEGHPPARWSAIFLLASISVAIPILSALWDVGSEGQWNWFSLSSALFHIPLLLAAAIVAAYALGRAGDVPRLLMAGLLISVVIDVLSVVLGAMPVLPRIAGGSQWFAPTWLALALATYGCRLVDPGIRRVAVLACCIVLVAVPLSSIYRDRGFWHEPYNPDDESGGKQARYGAGGEDVFYKQPELLAQELAAVRPGRKGAVDVFFIGMAGYGMQDVFRREVESVSQLLRERFGAEGHAIRLINNTKTLLDVPIASKTSLRAALKRVADVMDKDEDVLVLYMTSHGSEDHRFSLMLWPLNFHEIDPATLRQLLDESGIRNRVVIISACYSGGFVKPLEDPNTLVITASAANRNSFGCSNEAEWTYFGKAYFDEALRGTYSFTTAFERAKPKIAERERKDKFDASEPQMSIGSGIAPTLEALAKQLEGKMAQAR